MLSALCGWVQANALNTPEASTLETQIVKPAKINYAALQLPTKQQYRPTQWGEAANNDKLKKPLSLRNLFKKRKVPGVSYRAELVYDAVKGEDITGGKVHFKFPLN